MKTKDLEKILIERGYWVSRYSKHVIWTNGSRTIAIPHQKEVNRMICKKILRDL